MLYPERHNAGSTLKNGYYQFQVQGITEEKTLKQFGFLSIQLKNGGYLDVEDSTKDKKLEKFKCYAGYIHDVPNLGYIVSDNQYPLIEMTSNDFFGLREEDFLDRQRKLTNNV